MAGALAAGREGLIEPWRLHSPGRATVIGRIFASLAGMRDENDTSPVRSSIDRFMTPDPHCIGRDQTLSVAHERMRTLGVRHLPVLEGGKLVGLLSQRDLFFVETLRDVEPTTVPVEDAMSTDVYVVPPERALGEVAARMAERKYGCAVIAKGEHVTGIFTTSDALRVLVGIVEAWL